MNKKAAINLWMRWPEVLSFTLLIIGFIIAIVAGSAVISYIVVLVCGLYFGRMWFMVQKTIKTPWFLIIFCFLAGYLFGNFYGDPRIIIILFIIGILVGFYLYKKKIITA